MHGEGVTIVPGIASLEQCRAICQDEENCSYITYYGANSFPFGETCVTLPTCESVNSCTDCTTEDRACTDCSVQLETKIEENLVDFILDVEDESLCRKACTANISCKFYTHHNFLDTTYPGACFLLSGLKGPVRGCKHCQTGARTCRDANNCFFVSNDGSILQGGVLITMPNTSVLIESIGSCSVGVLAVGGGGAGFFGGGGSGFVEFTSLESSWFMELRVTVGAGGQKTVVTNEKGELVVEALAGAEGSSGAGAGGSGYSGGGGFRSSSGGDGGMDGSDGEAGVGGNYQPGGNGSGRDVSTIHLEGFLLS